MVGVVLKFAVICQDLCIFGKRKCLQSRKIGWLNYFSSLLPCLLTLDEMVTFRVIFSTSMRYSETWALWFTSKARLSVG